MPFYTLFVFFFCFLCFEMTTARADNRFYVSNIRVDVKDTSAAQARIKAIAQGQRKAFKILAEQLLSPEDQASLPQPTDDQLNGMIQDFEVQNEKNSNVRYIGTFTFHFYPVKVEAFLNHKEKKVLPAKINDKILVLPLYEEKEKIFLWQEDNAWRNAWNHASDLKAHYILPLGDLTDILAFPEKSALTKDLISLQALRERYHAGYVLLTILRHDSPFELSLYLYDSENLSYSEESLPLLGDSVLTPALMQKAVAKTTEVIEQFSAENSLAQRVEKHVFNARVIFDNHQEWIKIQKILAKMVSVKSLEVSSLQRRQALIAFQYTGSEKKIQQALEKQGFRLSSFSERSSSKIKELRLEEKQDVNLDLSRDARHKRNFGIEEKLRQRNENFLNDLERDASQDQSWEGQP